MTPYREFGAMLATARKARAMSRLEVANKLCVDPSFYARVENGLRTVSVITLALMWRHINIDANAVLETLPVEVAPRRKRKRHYELTAPFSALVELAGVTFDFDRLMARARNDAGLTRAELASAVDLSKRQIGRIECGHGLPSLPAFARLHRVLGFDANRALASLLGEKVSLKSPDRMRGATYTARPGGRRGPPAAHSASSRLWRGGPQLSVSVRDDWRCRCDELRVIVPGLTGMEPNEVPERQCIGYAPVGIRLQSKELELPFLLLSWDSGTEIEHRQPGLDGSLHAAATGPSAFMASLYGLVVAQCGLDVERLRGVLRVVAFVDRQCHAYVRGRGLAMPHA